MLLHQGLQVRALVVFDAEKRLRQFLCGIAAVFAVTVAVIPLTDCPSEAAPQRRCLPNRFVKQVNQYTDPDFYSSAGF